MASDPPETGQAVRRGPHPRTQHALPAMPTDDTVGLGLFGCASHNNEFTGTWARPLTAVPALVSFDADGTAPLNATQAHNNDWDTHTLTGTLVSFSSCADTLRLLLVTHGEDAPHLHDRPARRDAPHDFCPYHARARWANIRLGYSSQYRRRCSPGPCV